MTDEMGGGLVNLVQIREMTPLSVWRSKVSLTNEHRPNEK